METKSEVTVAVRNVNKVYTPPSSGSLLFARRRKSAAVQALKNVNFVTFAGESVGVIGRNGSGKSTLLRLIAGSEQPTSGDIHVSSQPTFLGVSAALQQHLSGQQNARLGLLAMGIEPKEASALIPEVLKWAEVESAATRPLSTYSSGMRSRLKFAIATAVNRDILIVDEALSTGDSAFASKAGRRMDHFLEEAGTVFIVSHSISMIEKRCNRAIWLHDGEIIADGTAQHVAKFYKLWSRRLSNDDIEGASQIIRRRKEEYSSNPYFLKSEVSST